MFGKIWEKVYNAGMRLAWLWRRRLAFSALVAAACIAPPSAVAREEEDVRVEMETGLIATPPQRAAIYFQRQEWQKLAEHARQWVSDYPGESAAWNYLGLAQQGEGKTKDATDSFLTAWKLSDKTDHRIIESIGDSYAKIGQWQDAESAYATAADLQPHRGDLWRKLATASLQLPGDEWTKKAAAALKRTLTFDDYIDDFGLWQRYAAALEQSGAGLDDKYLAYRHILRLQPNLISAWERLHQIETARGRDDEVEKIVEHLYRLDTDNVVANLHYGDEAMRKDHPKEARHYYEIGLRHPGVTGERRSKIYMALGEMQETPGRALSYYRDAAIHDPANTAAWEQVFAILKGAGRRREAEKVYAGLLSIKRKLKNDRVLSDDDTAALLSIR